jgi:hypothetical protein
MSAQLTIIQSATTRESDNRLAKLAGFMGLELHSLFLGQGPDDARECIDALKKVTGAVALHSQTLAQILETYDSQTKPESVLDLFEFAYIYGFSDCNGHDLAAALTNGALSRPSRIGAGKIRYRFAEDDLCRQLSGLSFSACATEDECAFNHSASAGTTARLITANKRPFLVATRLAGCEVFLCAAANVVDIDSEAAPGDPLPEKLPQLIPFLIFLKYAFGARCWQNPHSWATLIIDDPLLKPRYGFLSYTELLANMNQLSLASTIAFIPWNCRRSKIGTADLFRNNADRLSICVHGCNHTGAEFGSLDELSLRAKAFTALDRIGTHREITGLNAEPIMVFPQGVFSKAALRALAAENFLAAVNTSIYPIDSVKGDLKLKEVLDVAVSSSGFPLFGRRYPGPLLDFAVDLFMGKPALVAGHHDTFKHGYSQIRDLAEQLSELDSQLKWAPLEHSLTQSALYQRTETSAANVKFYTDRFRLENPYGEPTQFRLSRQIAKDHRVKQVLADGDKTRYQIDAECLTTEVSLLADGHADLRIERSSPARETDGVNMADTHYDPKVATRRYLSEFRDIYLARSERLMALSRRAARMFLP